MEGAALNGTYDAAMAARVRQFQQGRESPRMACWTVDHVVAAAQRDVGEIESGTIYEPGDVGRCARAQRALGMSEAGQTGDFGPTTREMLLEWQAKNGIQQTGRVSTT